MAPKSKLGKTVNYLIEEELYLRRYIEDGRLKIDNHRVERSIKPFVIGRKNRLFANTPNLKENESMDILLPWNAPDDCRSKSVPSIE